MVSPDPELEERLLELETRLAFQEEAIRKLEEAGAAREKQLLDLASELRELRQLLSRSELSPHSLPGEDPPPPHW